jgi:hypothetical protein
MGEDPVKGILINFEGKTGEFRLFAPDYPDWIEDGAAGIKLAPDQRTTTIMTNVLKNLEYNNELSSLFREFHDGSEKQKMAIPAVPGLNGAISS